MYSRKLSHYLGSLPWRTSLDWDGDPGELGPLSRKRMKTGSAEACQLAESTSLQLRPPEL